MEKTPITWHNLPAYDRGLCERKGVMFILFHHCHGLGCRLYAGGYSTSHAYQRHAANGNRAVREGGYKSMDEAREIAQGIADVLPETADGLSCTEIHLCGAISSAGQITWRTEEREGKPVHVAHLYQMPSIIEVQESAQDSRIWDICRFNRCLISRDSERDAIAIAERIITANSTIWACPDFYTA